MAQYSDHLSGKFDDLLHYIEENVVNGSMSASLEGGGDDSMDGVRCATRVFERYSYLGGHRLSLSVTIFGRDGDLHLTAVTAGGSQAMFFKINTWGEEAFLDKFQKQIDVYKSGLV